jgi:parallel beta-helix repeat protein
VDRGGGINGICTSTYILNCYFFRNNVNYSGGGTGFESSSPLLENCYFSENSSLGGGGFSISENSVTIKNCIFLDNISSGAGGGLLFWGTSSNSAIEDCIISGNSAADNGGGIYIDRSTPIIKNCIINNNSANWGAGIYSYSWVNPFIVNTTITGNIASYSGGAFGAEDGHSSFFNSILWNNSPDEIYTEYYNPEINYCDIKGGYPGLGNIDQEPLFVDPENEDFSLQSESPCIDTGDPESPVPWGGGYRIDMGALEFFKGFNVVDTLLVRKK